MQIDLRPGDCLDELRRMPARCADLVLTSPPYDTLRNYEGTLVWSIDIFKSIAAELERVLRAGGIVVWVVADKVSNGSESGNSFRQALYFMSLGLNLHDTMVYHKRNVIPLTHNRYEQAFEYMFVFSKGKPSTFNPIADKQNKWAGTNIHGKFRHTDGTTVQMSGHNKKKIAETGRRTNVWTYSNQGKRGTEHPATFPLDLAMDHIKTWTNEGDTVVDPFMGSGTTGIASKHLNRKFIGIEKVDTYFNIATKRISEA